MVAPYESIDRGPDQGKVGQPGGRVRKWELPGLGRRDQGPEAARVGAHVTRGQLVPRVHEVMVDGGPVGGVEADELEVAGVLLEREVGGQHADGLEAGVPS
jgi:hypothetical protein